MAQGFVLGYVIALAGFVLMLGVNIAKNWRQE